ncbi:hypothetical protein HC931_27390 [Candidatus Gracilibacteria bacterium]|nr:hypothetical protein [Candidatus Gracilibacteria bacterium]NJP22275.1 hypothetical protein [Hydrococcus sp. CRU_1_1]
MMLEQNWWKTFIKLSMAIICLFSLMACQSVTATLGSDELSYELRDDWNYAVKVVPAALMEKIAQNDVPSDWSGDPRRFAAIAILQKGQKTPLYLIEPSLLRLDGCPQRGCSAELLAQRSPFCGEIACLYFAYLEENGRFSKVFEEYIPKYLPPNYPFFRVSKQLNHGLPCLEFAFLPDRIDPEAVQVNTFCCNGWKYVGDRQYFEPFPEN